MSWIPNAVVALAGTFAVVAMQVEVAGAADQNSASRRAIVSAVDKDGVPIKDVTAADLAVKVAGKVQKVLDVQPATGPLRIAVLVADGGTGVFQAGLAKFTQKLSGRAEFQFTSVVVQPEKLGPYSGERNGIMPALNKLGVRGGARTGSQVMEAILDATKDVRTETTRPVIVVARLGGESPSDLSTKLVRAELQKSGAILFVVSVSGANRLPTSTAGSAGGDTMAQARAQFSDAEASEHVMNLGLILGDGSKESGGRHDEVVSATMGRNLESIADELLGQYVVTYSVRDDYKPTDRLGVSSKRKGMTVRAPSR